MKNILVTGGAGYIGSHLIISLSNIGYNPIIIDNFSNSKIDTISRIENIINKDVVYYSDSVCDGKALDKIFKKHEISGVIHLAAYKSVEESTVNPGKYYANNTDGFIMLLTKMLEYNVNNLLLSSSCTVYGDSKLVPFKESLDMAYFSPYGHTKVQCENIISLVRSSNPKFNFGSLRYFNPTGAHDSSRIGEDPVGKASNIMPIIIRVAKGDLPYLDIFGSDYPTKDGSPERDYLHVMDLVEGHLASLDVLFNKNLSHTINLGTGYGVTVLELVKAFESATGLQIPYKLSNRRPGDVPVAYADTNLAESVLGWKAIKSIEDMCKSAWEWDKFLSKYKH
jgi:UDP-glucose 4-epimerase